MPSPSSWAQLGNLAWRQQTIIARFWLIWLGWFPGLLSFPFPLGKFPETSYILQKSWWSKKRGSEEPNCYLLFGITVNPVEIFSKNNSPPLTPLLRGMENLTSPPQLPEEADWTFHLFIFSSFIHILTLAAFSSGSGQREASPSKRACSLLFLFLHRSSFDRESAADRTRVGYIH